MKSTHKLKLALLVGALVATFSFSARAVTEVDVQTLNTSGNSDNAYDGLIVPGEVNDLIYQKVGSVSDALTVGTVDSPGGAADPGPDIDFTIAGLTDGKSTDGTDPTQTFFGTTHFSNAFGMNFGNSLNYDPIVTFNLGSSPTGYTLATIQSIFGYTNETSFADQNFTIQYTTVGNSTWRTLATVADNPFAPPTTDTKDGSYGVATDVTLTALGVSGVNDIRFVFSPYVDSAVNSPTGQEQFGQVIRELEVNGVATVPEPGTWAMIGLGLAALVVVARIRFARA